jgi:hypothetical protein
MPILGVIASSIAKSTSSYDFIEQFTVTSNVTSVTLGSGGTIPQTYKHLQLLAFACSNRGTYGGVDVATIFNGDTGANYNNHTTSTDGGGSVASYNTSRTTNMWLFDCGSTVINNFNFHKIDILNYTDTNSFKTIRSVGGLDTNGTIAGFGGSIGFWSGAWRNTASITSMTFTVGSSLSFVAGTQFALFGIKG